MAKSQLISDIYAITDKYIATYHTEMMTFLLEDMAI